jgi:glycosyltransferase involved in cell wall biosynthesis
MRIGIDARELGGHATGAGRYLAGLLAEWSADDRARRPEFVLYAPEPIALPLDARRFGQRTIPGAAGTWWEQVRLPKAVAADHLDVFFAPAYTAPLRIAVPVVVAIHDVSFVAHPEWFRVREGIRRRWITERSAERARAIVTISEFSKRELTERLGLPPSRIHVIPPGIRRPQVTDPSLQREPRVLFVGSILNRRHVVDLIRAFGRVARSHPDAVLDLVGDNRSHPREDLHRAIAAEAVDGRIHWHEYVSNEELGRFYARAKAFAFLSEYEGLGLTPLEALAAGVPSVLADTPVAHESCGDAALFVSPHDTDQIARALERVLFDPPTHARLLAAAPAVLAKYDWRRAARDTLAVIESAGTSGFTSG